VRHDAQVCRQNLKMSKKIFKNSHIFLILAFFTTMHALYIFFIMSMPQALKAGVLKLFWLATPIFVFRNLATLKM
jgi:hypothetical protein